MPYPQDVDLAAGAVREPLSNVTNALGNPVLLSLAQPGRDDVQNRVGPTTEAGHSQTTDTSAASSGAHNDLSKLNAQARRPGPASTDQTTGAADGMSVCSRGTSDSKIGDSAYGTANDHHVDHELSHMAPWAQDNLSGLRKE
ncbi:hypothetical protein GGI42DRAFT_350835 [Trichoderma sp. SZMC 28013]